MSAIPKTPSFTERARNGSSTAKRQVDVADAQRELDAIYHTLARQWDLELPRMNGFESPRSQQARLKSEDGQLALKITQNLNFLFYKTKTELYAALDNFYGQATHLYSGWIYKPNADRGVIPEKTRERLHPITQNERKELLKCLRTILSKEVEVYRSQCPTPSSGRLQRSSLSKTIVQPDDSPVPFPYSSAQKHDSKRPLETFPDIDVNSKKAKGSKTNVPGRESLSRFPPPQWSVSRPQITKTDQVTTTPSKGDGKSNMNTSFETNISSVFSQTLSSTLVNTQTTDPHSESESEPEPEPILKLRNDILPLDNHNSKTQSSDFGSSFDPAEAERLWCESFGAKISSENAPNKDLVDDMTDCLVDDIAKLVDEKDDATNRKGLEGCLNEMLRELFHRNTQYNILNLHIMMPFKPLDANLSPEHYYRPA